MLILLILVISIFLLPFFFQPLLTIYHNCYSFMTCFRLCKSELGMITCCGNKSTLPAIVFFGKQLVGMFKTCSCRSAYEILCVSILGAADFSSTSAHRLRAFVIHFFLLETIIKYVKYSLFIMKWRRSLFIRSIQLFLKWDTIWFLRAS